jgi:hypothetical protein
VFIARYGLIAYIKKIFNPGGKCLQRGTDLFLVYSRFITVVESVYSVVRTDYLHKADIELWWKAFTVRYGLVAYIKWIYNRGGKCLQCGTD